MRVRNLKLQRSWASADAGTLIEVGWFLGKGKPIPGPHRVYGFLTTSPNAVVEPIHPKCGVDHR